MTRRAAAAALAAMAAFALPAAAQSTAKTDAPGQAVTLDQLSPTEAAQARDKSRPADLDVPQPAHPARAAAVTSSEITDRADGRALATTALSGDDRCDPAHAAADELCRHRLETEAGRFARPTPAPVTPEARLLLLVDPNAGASGTAEARRMGVAPGGDAANGPAEQVAAALRDQSAAQDAAAAEAAKSAAQAALPANVPTVAVLPGR